MKSDFATGARAGALAGVVADIAGVACSSIFVPLGVLEHPLGPDMWNNPLIMLFTLAFSTLGLIWGAIFGAIYSIVYDSIPNKGVTKGLCFGLIIWLIKDIAAGSFIASLILEFSTATTLIVVGFFMWIAYGPVLGSLYKKRARYE